MGGLFGAFSPNSDNAASLAYLGLYALQHRGQESAGMVVSNGRSMRMHKAPGLVSHVFDNASLARLEGRVSVGHVRYSTSGHGDLVNLQPLYVVLAHGEMALTLTGSITNADALRAKLLGQGAAFQTTTHEELMVHLINSHSDVGLEEAIARSVGEAMGGYALIIMTNDQLIGVRDPAGIRPLMLGRKDDALLLASESSALDTCGGEMIRDVAPAEMIIIDDQGWRSRLLQSKGRHAFCVFEYVYFARSDSVMQDKTIHEVRKEIGRKLARQCPIEADLVIPAPDSALSAALGYAEESGIPFDMGLAKNRYVGRTFIQPTEDMRKIGVQIKLNPIAETVRGRRVILVDDSIVRGTTSAKMVELLRRAGAKEVHMAVASPPFLYPCHYGIDVPAADQLIASERSMEEIRELIGADSLTYLTLDSLFEAVGTSGDKLCSACFGGGHPIEISAKGLRP